MSSDPIERALAEAPFGEARRQRLARQARQAIDRWRADVAAGYDGHHPRPRERAPRLRALASAARASALAERELAGAVGALFPPDNLTAIALLGELQGQQSGPEIVIGPQPDGHPSCVLREARQPRALEHAATLETIAEAADRLAARWERQPAGGGRPRLGEARKLVEYLALAWGASAWDREGNGLDDPTPFEHLALAAFAVVGVEASLSTIQRALRELGAAMVEAHAKMGFPKRKRGQSRRTARTSKPH